MSEPMTEERFAEIKHALEFANKRGLYVKLGIDLLAEVEQLKGELAQLHEEDRLMNDAPVGTDDLLDHALTELHALKHPPVLNDITDALVGRVEDEVGMGAPAWDCVDPRAIIVAAFNVLLSQRVTLPTPPTETETEAEDELLRCVNCGHVAPLQHWDIGGADAGKLFCNQCHTEQAPTETEAGKDGG